MNVFFRELGAHRKGLFFWCIGMILLVSSGIAKFYGYSSAGSSSTNVTQVYQMFPHSFQVLFGLNGFDLTTPSGVYGILFMYIVATAAIHAVLLGTDLISKEERDKTAEFIYAKPISRASVITQKLSAGLVNLVVLNIFTLITSVYMIDYFSKSTGGVSDVVLMDSGLFVVQLIFFLFGAMVAAISKRPKAAAGIATTALLTTFILYFVINLSGNIDYLSYFTPFKYFDARTVIADGHLDTIYVSLSLVIMLVTLVTTYAAYQVRDLEV